MASRKLHGLNWALGSSSLALILAANAAAAQTTPTASSGNPPSIETVVVSSTRVVRSGYNAPTPTLEVGKPLLEDTAPSTVVDALATLPVFKGTLTTGTAGPVAAGNGGQGFVDLRGLGANRTLVLFNSQRFVPSTDIGTVDINLLPAGLIKRIDVVTGGASADYGSDAVSGVVNFVLDSRFKGLKGEVSGGVSSRGDAGNEKVSLTAGKSFMDDRLHVVASGEYLNSDPLRPLSRPWARNAYGIVANQGATAANGEPKRLILPYVYYGSATENGLINSGPLKGIEFLGNGLTRQFQYCNYVSSSAMACDGIRPNLSNVDNLTYLRTALARTNFYGRATYDITPNISAYVDYLYGWSRTGFGSAPPDTVHNGNLTIHIDNPFLPTSVRDKMVAAGITSFSLGRIGNDIGVAFENHKNVVNRVTAGVDGEFDGYVFHLYGEHGKTVNQINISNATIVQNWHNAVDAVMYNGQIVCRSTITDPTNGCIPANMFGENQFNSQLRSYMFGTSRRRLTLEENTIAFNVSGEPFSIWSGPVSIAVGADYRENKAVQTVSARDAASVFSLGNFKPLNGRMTVAEGFGELVVPLLKDVPFAKGLELNTAARITSYSTSGLVVTWKAGVTWKPVDGLRFRATRSRDIRAANLLELYSSSEQSSTTIVDPQTNSTVSFQTLSTGNPHLVPERADTSALGVVVQPDFIPGFNASIDYYNIKVNKAISTYTPLDIVTRCYDGQTSLCSLVDRNSSGAITLVREPYLNLSSVKTSGLDFDASYRTPLDSLFGPGSGNLAVRLLANRVIDYIQSDGVTSTDLAGSLSDGIEKWSGNLNVQYELGAFKMSTDVTYLGGGKYNNRYKTAIDLAGNHVGAVTYVNLNLSYMIPINEGEITLFGDVNNLFDQAPPGIFSVWRGLNYDRVGRAFKFGMRFNF